jgi:hydroxymethylpyrimidine/phosphomethylpyrimidine kinase
MALRAALVPRSSSDQIPPSPLRTFSRLCVRECVVFMDNYFLGVAGTLYVAEDVVPAYRSMLHLATIITPNWFEVE